MRLILSKIKIFHIKKQKEHKDRYRSLLEFYFLIHFLLNQIFPSFFFSSSPPLYGSLIIIYKKNRNTKVTDQGVSGLSSSLKELKNITSLNLDLR